MSHHGSQLSRAVGQALVVTSAAGRESLVARLERLGYTVAQADDPYAAMRELLLDPTRYVLLVLGLAGIYREELTMVQSVKRHLPHIRVAVAQCEGRHSMLMEATRLGAHALLDDAGLHPLDGEAGSPSMPVASVARVVLPAGPVATSPVDGDDSEESQDPLLTAEELRALLHDPGARASEDP